MNIIAQYSMAVAVVIVALLPIKSYDSLQSKSMHLGFVVALAINLYFYFRLSSDAGVLEFRRWHLAISVFLPAAFVIPLFLVFVVAKGMLRGGTPAKQWGVEEARNLLAHDKSVFRRASARMLIASTPPMLFFLGWGLGSVLIVRFVFNNH